MSRSPKLLLAVAIMLLATPAAFAANYSLQSNLDALQVVPPNASPAFGDLTGTVDDTTDVFSVTLGDYSGLLGGSVQVLLNIGAPGSNGAFIGALTNDTAGATTGTYSGSLNLTGAQASSMIAGNTYIRVTSTVFPAGEIRGQLTVVPAPEPGTLALAAMGGLGLLLMALKRRRLAR